MVRFRKLHPPAGARPGTLLIPRDADPPRVRLIRYNECAIEDREVDDVDAVSLGGGFKNWIDVQGLGSEAALRQVGTRFGLHPLALEDVVNVPQRPKTEIYPDHLLLITRAARLTPGMEPRFEQVAIFLGEDYVLTFQERHSDVLEPVAQRLHVSGNRPIRRFGSDYLAYAILDAVVDGYYPLEERIAEYLEQLEPRVLQHPVPRMLDQLAEVSRMLVTLRRVLVPQRAAVGVLLETEFASVSDDVRPFVRDTLDHCAQLVEGNESNRELTTALMNTYLSVMSHRTNEVMKVLTVMASLFIPLTFLAGIYGMNFEAMPELQSAWGYPALLGLMALVAVGMLVFFQRRGWLGDGEGGDDDEERLF